MISDSYSRFEWTGDLADIENAIYNNQRAVELTPPGHADLPARLRNLGNSFESRFEHTGDLAGIENAISNTQRAVELTPLGHSNLSACLNNLGNSCGPVWVSLRKDWRPRRH